MQNANEDANYLHVIFMFLLTIFATIIFAIKGSRHFHFLFQFWCCKSSLLRSYMDYSNSTAPSWWWIISVSCLRRCSSVFHLSPHFCPRNSLLFVFKIMLKCSFGTCEGNTTLLRAWSSQLSRASCDTPPSDLDAKTLCGSGGVAFKMWKWSRAQAHQSKNKNVLWPVLAPGDLGNLCRISRGARPLRKLRLKWRLRQLWALALATFSPVRPDRVIVGEEGKGRNYP